MSMGNIHIHVDLIAGLPYETLEDFKQSFNRAYALQPHVLQLGFLKLLHGSKLRNQAEDLEIKYNQEPPYEIISSPWLSVKDLKILKQTENALQHTYNKGRFLSVLAMPAVSNMSPFNFYQALGEFAPSHATHLEIYATQVFDFCKELPGVDENQLRDCMIYDLLSMAKGKSMPSFLKSFSKEAVAAAEKLLGRTVGRTEAAVLSSGQFICVDNEKRNPITGLYKVYYL